MLPTTAFGIDLTGTDPVALGQAATAVLPATTSWSVESGSGRAVPPGQEPRAVVTALSDGSRLIMMFAAHSAHDLTAAVDGVVQYLVRTHGDVLSRDDVEETGGALHFTPGEVVVSALLRDGQEHVGTAVLVTTPPPAEDMTAAALHEFSPLEDSAPGSARGGLELLGDVEMSVTAELGRTRMLVRQVLDLAPGSVIELDRAAGSPVDVLVNGTLIARGEVVVIDEEFGVRITEIIGFDGQRD